MVSSLSCHKEPLPMSSPSASLPDPRLVILEVTAARTSLVHLLASSPGDLDNRVFFTVECLLRLAHTLAVTHPEASRSLERFVTSLQELPPKARADVLSATQPDRDAKEALEVVLDVGHSLWATSAAPTTGRSRRRR